MFHYFKGHLSHGFVSIYSARMILRIAGSFLGLFLPIFLYKLFDFQFSFVIFYYLIGHLLYTGFVAFGAMQLNKIGLRRSFRISIFLGAVYYILFYLIEQYSFDIRFEFSFDNPLLILLIVNILILTLHRTLYWVPLHTDLAKFTSKKDRAKQLSIIEVATLILGAICPLISGWILSKYDYSVLFIIAIVVYLLALVPLMTLPHTKERFSWGYLETWKEFFSKKRRKTVLAFMGDGAEQSVGSIVWPIFIYELLQGNFFEMGVLSSLVVFITIFLQLAVGKFTDVCDKRKMLHWGSIFYAFGWLIKIFIVTAFHIFIASAFHNFAKIFARTPFDTISYDRAADQGHFVDEYTVIHEIAIQSGKFLMLIFVLMLIPFFEIQWIFILAALASLAMNYLADDELLEQGRH